MLTLLSRVVSFVSLAACGLSSAQATDWPQWRGPNRDGAWNETGIIESFPAEGLNIAWRVPAGRGWSSAVISQGRVYVTDVELAGKTARERILCLDERSGKLLWTHSYHVDYPDWAFGPDGGGPRATPIVRDGRVFTLGAMGHLFCLDARRGTTVWQKNLAKEYGVTEFTGITASPLIEDNLLVLYICGKPAACVVAFEKSSGKEIWRALDDSFTYSSPIVVAAGGKKQLIVWTQQAVTSLDARTGQTFWREVLQTSGDSAVSTPVYADGLLYAAGLMLKLDTEKPRATVLWPQTRAASKRVLSNTSTALILGESLYSAKTSGELVCLDVRTGEQRWSTNTITELKNGSSIHITPCGDSVFLFTDRGDLILAKLNPQGYREVSRTHLLRPTSPFGARKCAWVPPAYANRHVFVRNDEELVCASLEKARVN